MTAMSEDIYDLCKEVRKRRIEALVKKHEANARLYEERAEIELNGLLKRMATREKIKSETLKRRNEYEND